MQNSKDKLYNYETPPPEEVWSNITKQLDNEKVNKMPFKRRSRILFYATTAAAAIVIIFISNQFFNKKTATKPIVQNTTVKVDQLLSQKTRDSINLNYQILETIINAPEDQKLLAYNHVKQEGFAKKYITIAGPEDQPVKISPKVATLIISADNEYPPRLVWDKKIDKWKQIMLNSTLSPTSTNLMDIFQTAAANVE